MNAHQAIARLLKREGVEYLFCYPSNTLIEACAVEGIRPILARDYASKARRPLNSRLDATRFQTTFGYFFPTWQEGIRQLIKTLKDEGRL